MKFVSLPLNQHGPVAPPSGHEVIVKVQDQEGILLYFHVILIVKLNLFSKIYINHTFGTAMMSLRHILSLFYCYCKIGVALLATRKNFYGNIVFEVVLESSHTAGLDDVVRCVQRLVVEQVEQNKANLPLDQTGSYYFFLSDVCPRVRLSHLSSQPELNVQYAFSQYSWLKPCC